MTGDGQSIEQLQDYLRKLKPEARSMLLQELERGLLRGGDNAGNELILQELRLTIRAVAEPVPRIGNAERLFFAPLEPFLIDARADHRRVGRVARVSLEPIWAWINRDLIHAEAKALGEDINRALLQEDRTKADQLVRALQDRAVQRMKEAVARVGADEKARRRIAVEVGTPRAVDDLNTIIPVLSLRDTLADLGKRLPSQIRTLERDQIDGIRRFLDAAAAQQPPDAASRRPDILAYGLILVMTRLATKWQLIRIATRAAESDAAAVIAATPYAPAVAIVLGELESMIDDLRSELKTRRPIVSLLKGIHDVARGLRAELNLSVDSAWSRQLAALCADVSALLKTEIEATPGLIRRLLRPRPAREIAPGEVLDGLDVNEAETRVEFVSACRHYASELAVSEVTARAYSELTLYLETGIKVLLDSVRHAGDGDRPFRQSQVDAAIRFCRIIFGTEYASLLAKAAEMAVQSVAAERKVAKV